MNGWYGWLGGWDDTLCALLFAVRITSRWILDIRQINSVLLHETLFAF